MIPHKQLEAHQHTSVPDRRLTSHTSEQKEKSGRDLQCGHKWVNWTPSHHHRLSLPNQYHMDGQIVISFASAVSSYSSVFKRKWGF